MKKLIESWRREAASLERDLKKERDQTMQMLLKTNSSVLKTCATQLEREMNNGQRGN